MIVLICMPDSPASGPTYAIVEQGALAFRSEPPVFSEQDYVVALLPASMIAFASLPAPAVWLSGKKKLAFIRQNMPEPIIYDQTIDNIVIWTTENKKITFAIVNKELWESWQEIFNISDAIIPEWKLIRSKEVPAVVIAKNNYGLIRTDEWNAQLCLTEHEINPITVSESDIFYEVIKCPLPLEINVKRAKNRKRACLRYGAVGFLLTGILLQGAQIYAFHHQQLLREESGIESPVKMQDQFNPMLQVLVKASDVIPFRLTKLNYEKGKSSISLISYQNCQQLATGFGKYNKNIRIINMQAIAGNQQCQAEMEINS